MKSFCLLGSCLALCLTVSAARAQNNTGEVEQIRRQLQQANEAFQKAVENYRQVTESLNQRLEQLQPKDGRASPVAPTNPPAAPGTNNVLAAAAAGTKPWTPSDPIRIGTAQNYIGVSFDTLVAAGYTTAKDVESLQLGGHDPKQRGFTVQNLETTYDGKVDPYFRGQANIVLQIDPEGETTIEAEEAYLETMALPWNLQVKAGQYFAEFGRLNPTHPHTWDFVDQPLVNGRFFGEDGLRNAGARVSWLVPTPFYSELFLGMQNSQGETATSFRDSHEDSLRFGRPAVDTRVKGFGDMLYVPRYVASFNLSD